MRFRRKTSIFGPPPAFATLSWAVSAGGVEQANFCQRSGEPGGGGCRRTFFRVTDSEVSFASFIMGFDYRDGGGRQFLRNTRGYIPAAAKEYLVNLLLEQI